MAYPRNLHVDRSFSKKRMGPAEKPARLPASTKPSSCQAASVGAVIHRSGEHLAVHGDVVEEDITGIERYVGSFVEYDQQLTNSQRVRWIERRRESRRW